MDRRYNSVHGNDAGQVSWSHVPMHWLIRARKQRTRPRREVAYPLLKEAHCGAVCNRSRSLRM